MGYDVKLLTSRILDVRYTDLEEEEKLCRELLKLSESSGDAYGQMFAHTFLGDYFIAINDAKTSGDHLLKALMLMENADVGECDDVKLRIYSLLGIFYEHKADEQNSIQYYIAALAIARKLNDTVSECAILNNMAFSFQRHNDSERALEYFQLSYDLQKEQADSLQRIIFVSNMAEALLVAGKTEEALQYIKECEKTKADPILKERCLQLNWCLYYAKKGELEKCVMWADEILTKESNRMQEKMLEFENYNVLFQCMMNIGYAKNARAFLRLMEETCNSSGVDQINQLEKKRIEYVLAFEPEEQHFEAYMRYYAKMEQVKKSIDETIASSMKAIIRLKELNRSKEELANKQEQLKNANDIDELTGSFSRRHFENIVRKHSEAGGCKDLSVVMVDVDYFKEYNDYYKHIKGDEVLQAVSECLDENKMEGIYPCRFGGDEFTCICEGLSEAGVREYIAAVRADLEKRDIEHKKSLCSGRVTLSMGVAIGEGLVDPNIAMETADMALYESKRKGRNGVTVKLVDSA